MGQKVLMIDADAQQNLSLIVRGKLQEDILIQDDDKDQLGKKMKKILLVMIL